MRSDSSGLFWNDISDKVLKKINYLKENDWVEILPGYWVEEDVVTDSEIDHYQAASKLDVAYAYLKANANEKCVPPEPVWLLPSYLPHLEESRQFKVNLFTDQELGDAALEYALTGVRHQLIFDIECYINYFLIAFVSIETGKVVYFEKSDLAFLDIPKFKWVLDNFCVVGFNSRNYDLPIAALALAGKSNSDMKRATAMIIEEEVYPSNVLRHFKVKKLKLDHIDVMEVAPLRASLKIYAGRLHAPRMQDLPFHHDVTLNEDQISIVRWYCVNDLVNTAILKDSLKDELDLRIKMSADYTTDLRSKSDAQIAEAIISAEVSKLNGRRPQKPEVHPGSIFYYQLPAFIKFQTPLMNNVLGTVLNTPFVVSEYGNVGMPEQLKELEIRIANAAYTLGIGGLHSTEKKTTHYADKFNILLEKDVRSYYPEIIRILGLFPAHIGPNFLAVFSPLIERRLKAKALGHTKDAGSLKIVINGAYGKLGSSYSILYSPNLMIQVTITGQLSLLMLIEALELKGIPVVSANTDGIVIKCPVDKELLMEEIVAYWENITGFIMEATMYSALHSRDVNNYIAVKHPISRKPGKSPLKSIGVLSKAGLRKNPTNEICIDAIENLLLKNIPIEKTINACNDITKFVNVRTVKGGAVKDGEYLGKAIRWYYANKIEGNIIYASTGKKVPRSDGAKPMMDMPEYFPNDVNFKWYEKETNKMLKHIGYY